MRPTLLSEARSKVALCGAAFAGLSVLAGCASAPVKPTPLPTEHYAVQVADVPERIALAVHPEGVSATQQTALADFVARWRDAGGGPILVKTPAGQPDCEQARPMTYAVQAQLEALGVPADRIRLAAYNAEALHAPVLASFTTLQAQGPDCSGGWDNLTSTIGNEPYHHFGCAMTANLAAQIADPRDLVSPPGLSPADGVRRQTVLGKYRDGKLTASDKDDQASGTVSSAVK